RGGKLYQEQARKPVKIRLAAPSFHQLAAPCRHFPHYSKSARQVPGEVWRTLRLLNSWRVRCHGSHCRCLVTPPPAKAEAVLLQPSMSCAANGLWPAGRVTPPRRQHRMPDGSEATFPVPTNLLEGEKPERGAWPRL